MEVVRCLQEEDQVDIQPAGFPGSPPGTGPGGQPPLTDCGPPGPPEPTKHGLTCRKGHREMPNAGFNAFLDEQGQVQRVLSDVCILPH